MDIPYASSDRGASGNPGCGLTERDAPPIEWGLATVLKPCLFPYEPPGGSELGYEDLSRARHRHRCRPGRNLFFFKDYHEVCRYMRTIGYGSKGKAETVEQQVERELKIGRYCSLRTTVRGRQSTQDIALFIYHDVSADLLGSGLVAVSFDTGRELAKEFVDVWFQKADAAMKEGLSSKEDN
ncbi:MAG: hypothetical protein C5B58_07605 [Acidobacteria bacterium]|nr:MAG: hypothetical protein C5B58_07605 [Acidobacteriota bacterium]